MSRCIVWIFLLAFLPFGLLEVLANPVDVGFRVGSGQRVPGRLDSNLGQFSSSFNPFVFSDINLSGGKDTATYEGFIRLHLDSTSKFGLTVGRQDLSKLALTEVTSDAYLTKLNSEIFSYHLLLTYHFITPLTRNLEWENGLGMGFTSADWQIRGYSLGGIDNPAFFLQRGNFRGNGLAFRLETAINQRLGETNYIQFGLGYHHIAIAGFAGNYNGEASSIYLGSNGQVGVFDDTRVLDVNLSTAQNLRRLDMNSGSWNLYFSIVQRFLD
jgi:hypothetical protein